MSGTIIQKTCPKCGERHVTNECPTCGYCCGAQTVRAPSSTPSSSSGGLVVGTIGFDLYVAALGVSRDALKTAMVPT